MHEMRKLLSFITIFLVVSGGFALSPLPVFGQDQPSLGDAARQARLQKQQKEAQTKNIAGKEDATDKVPLSKDAQADPAARKTPKVITNEDLPEHAGPSAPPPASHNNLHNNPQVGTSSQPSAETLEARGQALKSQIASMKNYIASLQSQIDSLNDSVHFAPGNCVSNCVQWNERQVQKQQQVEQMKAQLEDLKKHLDDMQESARQQGFGSAVYDP